MSCVTLLCTFWLVGMALGSVKYGMVHGEVSFTKSHLRVFGRGFGEYLSTTELPAPHAASQSHFSCYHSYRLTHSL